MTYQLCDPVVDNQRGIRDTNYFNGRLLAAEDLRTQQLADQQHREQLGRALGSGVVSGLQVAPAPADPFTVTVAAGLAINRTGQVLELPTPIELAIAVARTATSPGAQFVDCSTFQPMLATGMGAYALLLSPSSGFLQNAPMSGLGAAGAITGCGARYQVDGVTFRLVRFDPSTLTGFPTQSLAEINDLMTRTNLADPAAAPPTDSADLSMLRNRLAHACLGTEQLAALPRDPFAVLLDGSSIFAQYGALDALRGAPNGMTDDDVALALIYWTQIGVRFVDMWALRRRPGPPGYGPPWDPLISTRREREAEAAFCQFQDQLQWLLDKLASAASVVATTFFRFLPAAGLVPLGRPTRSGVPLDVGTFTQGLVVRSPVSDQVFLDGARLRGLLHASLAYPPVDLTVLEMLWLYSAVENRMAIDSAALPSAAAYSVFARGQMPFFGIPREDVNRWDYSTYV